MHEDGVEVLGRHLSADSAAQGTDTAIHHPAPSVGLEKLHKAERTSKKFTHPSSDDDTVASPPKDVGHEAGL